MRTKLRLASAFIWLLIMVASQIAHGGEDASIRPRIVGKWKSDVDKTMAFNKKYAKLEREQAAALNQLFGRLTITFTDDTYTVHSDAQSITKNGKTIEVDELTEQYQYSVIGRTVDAVAIKTMEEDGDEYAAELETWHFIDENHAWIYVGDTSPFGLCHLREYFRRVKE